MLPNMLCRAGIGEMTIIDGDVVELTNKNRQLPALDCNLGKAKAEIMAGRFRNINPEIKLHVINDFIRDDRMIEVLKMARYDYIVDAIDTLAPKIFLIYHSLQLGLPVVSSMGSGENWILRKLQWRTFRKVIIAIWRVCCVNACINWGFTKG